VKKRRKFKRDSFEFDYTCNPAMQLWGFVVLGAFTETSSVLVLSSQASSFMFGVRQLIFVPVVYKLYDFSPRYL